MEVVGHYWEAQYPLSVIHRKMGARKLLMDEYVCRIVTISLRCDRLYQVLRLQDTFLDRRKAFWTSGQ